MASSQQFKDTIARIDLINDQDPNKEDVDGNSISKELLYSQRMSQELKAFAPDASETLQIAARAQHIGRWKIARDTFPMDRPGYLKWRNSLKALHADTTEEILSEVGYSSESIQEVRDLIEKKGLKKNPETQTLEDVICLVFIKFYLSDFAEKHTDEKIIEILRKTWRKMSDRGHQAAKAIDLDPKIASLVSQAIS